MPDWVGGYVKVLLVVCVVWWGFWGCGLAIDSEARDHFRGASDKETVDVLDVRLVHTLCGKRKDMYEITYRRAGEGAVSTYAECRKHEPDLGPQDVWFVRDNMYFDSPAAQRLWSLLAPFPIAGLVAWQQARRRRSSD